MPQRGLSSSPQTQQFFVGVTLYTIHELWFHTGTGRNRDSFQCTMLLKSGCICRNMLSIIHVLTGFDSTKPLWHWKEMKHKDDLPLDGLKNLGTYCTAISHVQIHWTFNLYGKVTWNFDHGWKHLNSSKLLPLKTVR